MRLVNPELITEIVIKGECVAVPKERGYDHYSYLPGCKISRGGVFSFLFKSVEYPEGYYLNGLYNPKPWIIEPMLTKKEVEDSETAFIKDGMIYSYPKVKLFINDTLISTIYMKSFEEAETYVKTNFPKVNVNIS